MGRAFCVHVDLVAVLRRLGRDCQFVPTFPAHFYFTGRRHPTPVGALARDAGEFARAATKRPGTLKRGLAASGGYFALERTPVPVPVDMFVDEVAALEAAAGDKVSEAPVRELGGVARSQYAVLELAVRLHPLRGSWSGR